MGVTWDGPAVDVDAVCAVVDVEGFGSTSPV